jgi:hypothetical protein
LVANREGKEADFLRILQRINNAKHKEKKTEEAILAIVTKGKIVEDEIDMETAGPPDDGEPLDLDEEELLVYFLHSFQSAHRSITISYNRDLTCLDQGIETLPQPRPPSLATLLQPPSGSGRGHGTPSWFHAR